MEQATLGVKSATGGTLGHFLCNRGNEKLLEYLLDHFDEAYGREALTAQLNIVTEDGPAGKSAKDEAMRNNSVCRNLLSSRAGSTSIHP